MSGSGRDVLRGLQVARTQPPQPWTEKEAQQTTAQASKEKSTERGDVWCRKNKEPYVADFCTKINLQGCGENQYQCDKTAHCIARTNVCDNFPDCVAGDDENVCGSGVCPMGMLECKDGTACFAMSDRCNNYAQCADGTDEEGCSWSTDPVVSVRCFEITRFSTATITTTTSTTTTTTTKTLSTTTGIIVVPIVIGVLLILAATVILLVYMKRRRLTTETKLHEHDHQQHLSEIGAEQGQGHQCNDSNEERDHEIPVNAYERLNMYVNDSLAGEMYQQLNVDKGEAYQEMHYVKDNAGNKDRHFTKQINLQEPDQERTQSKAVSFKEQGRGQETDVDGGERDLEISSNAYERLNLYVNDNLAGEMYEQLDAGQSRDYR
ncbi:uncharacterized protein LOC123538371 [Mercenaria mercenaria]|uniref:uncharacterized protein LOC123538371 n=1 Tax=Mercenaria mercenaria TaxID=6596 RepID=UPI00234EEBBC|nr:uncharacterized protein LOC123538371 [Mercenaria mercenaria]